MNSSSNPKPHYISAIYDFTVASTSQLTAGKVNIIVKYFMSPE